MTRCYAVTIGYDRYLVPEEAIGYLIEIACQSKKLLHSKGSYTNYVVDETADPFVTDVSLSNVVDEPLVAEPEAPSPNTEPTPIVSYQVPGRDGSPF